MLNVPAAVISALQTDSIRKNILVHFPNAEYPDLTNSDIVNGSFRFSESISSADVLKFGAAEASGVSFECANVPNIYGAVIEVSIVVDPDALAYPIPLGTFVVTSCPRTAGNMYRRKVEAYTFGGKQLQPSDYARRLVNYPTWSKPLRLSVVPYLMSATQSDLGLNPIAYTPLTLITGARIVNTPTWTAGGHTYMLTVTGNNPKYAALNSAAYKLTAESVNYSVYNQMFAKMESLGATSAAMKDTKNKVLPGYDFVYVGSREQWSFPDPAGSSYDSGYFFGANASDQYVFIPDAQTAVLTEDGTTIETYNLSGFLTGAAVTPYNVADVHLSSLELRIDPSFQDEGTKAYMYLGAVDFPALYEGFMELLGSFGQISRDGTVKRITLSKSNPVNVSMNEYAADSCWWDEYTVEPIGTVRYSYFDPVEDTEQTIDYTIGNGLSIYDMTGNTFLKSIWIPDLDLTGQTIRERIETLLDNYFAPVVQDIDFVPVDLEMIGLPYLEAGDYLVFDVGGGQTIGTYMMSRTMSGIHQLMDSVESKGGEIISEGGRNV